MFSSKSPLSGRGIFVFMMFVWKRNIYKASQAHGYFVGICNRADRVGITDKRGCQVELSPRKERDASSPQFPGRDSSML